MRRTTWLRRTTMSRIRDVQKLAASRFLTLVTAEAAPMDATEAALARLAPMAALIRELHRGWDCTCDVCKTLK